MGRKLVAYYRVSTKGQGESGLGLEAQRAAVEAYAKANDGEVIREYQEIESGKNDDRAELLKAIAHAKRSRSLLIIARLCRLSRSLAFTAKLLESGVDFVACDNPHATKLTIHILASVNEEEARCISERTKAALGAYKARGGLLGAHRPEAKPLAPESRAKGRQVASQKLRTLADEAYADLAGMIVELRDAGHSLRTIAKRLNEEGQTTRRGKPWNQVQVKRILERQRS